ncbi:MAG TPA: hypothetical protein VMW47_03230 [Verrucomicrobiae bacterium]|nr:hypothetical protein [Verrucomicrobiae bacterium]
MDVLDVTGGVPEFDRVAASLRADASDLATFLEVLAHKLADALPGGVQVERAGGPFRKPKRVVRLRCDLGDERFQLARQATGLEAVRTQVVRGIALKSEVVTLDAWIDALSAALARSAASNAAASMALSRLVT